MSSSKGPSDEAGRVEEAVQSLLSRMNKLQKWAELQMQIDKSISELPFMQEVSGAVDLRQKLQDLLSVLGAREVTTKATEQSLAHRVEDVARREAAASRIEETLQQRATTQEKQMAEAQHEASLAQGQRSVYLDLAQSAEAERVNLSEEHGRWEVLSREASSQLNKAKEQHERVENDRAELSERKGGLDERERQLKEREEVIARQEAKLVK